MESNFFLKIQMIFVYKTETDLQILKMNLWLAKWGGRSVSQELEMNIHTLLYIR